MASAFITGIAGQDGSYLTELLLKKGYAVTGMVRSSRTESFDRIAHLRDRIQLVQADLLDQVSLIKALEAAQPDEVYNLAAQSFIPTSWEQPVLTGEFTALGVARLLEAVRTVNPRIRFYQASSSEMFGNARESPQNEQTPLAPRTPYGVAKSYGHFLVINYRERYGLFAVSGILFNHESPRRGKEFVTRKISHAAARIALGLTKELQLGALDVARDWGFAGDYVEAMWLMLRQPHPGDFVVGTGVAHTVQDFLDEAFGYLKLDWREFVRFDPNYTRPVDPANLVADSSKARSMLGWKPRTAFPELVRMMVDSDLRSLKPPG
jgi:GDPmannose 4,6-dehydratase